MMPSGDATPMVIFLLVIFLVGATNTQAQVCPERCDCQAGDGGTIVHCKYQRKNGFPALDQFPSDTVELDYEYNNITILSSIPALRNLQRLNLDSCEIHTISANAFANVPALKNISLKKNKIDTLDRRAFNMLSDLEGLYMEDNQLGVLPAGVFESLNLVDLNLNGGSIHSLNDNTFNGLTVQHLYMKGNNISHLTAGYLRPLKDTLVSFQLDNNQQNLLIDPDTFEGFGSLEALSLRSSKIMDIDFLSEVNVKSLYLSGNMFPELDLRPFPNIASVETLELSNMGLRMFEADKILSHLNVLKKLDLSNNDLNRLESIWFSVTPSLSELILSGNKLEELPLDLSDNLQQLTSLDLSMNQLVFPEPQSFSKMSKLRTLNLARNKIRVFPEALKSLFTQVTSLFLLDNPLHCNCEMHWYKDWLANVPNGNFETQCSTPRNTYIFNLQSSQFQCDRPTFLSVESLVYITPGDDLLLVCTARGDPAPIVKWVDHYNDSITVSPSNDRSVVVNSNSWQLNSVTEEYSGLYRCTASNLAGIETAITRVIVTDKIPSTTEPPSTTTTTTRKPSTTTETDIPTTIAEATPHVIPSKKPSTSRTGATTSKSDATTDNSKIIIDQKTLAIIIGSVGGFIIICVVIFLIVHIARHNQNHQRYEVNDKAVIYHHGTNELDLSKDSKQINV